jgi:hypothetical protein
LRAQDPQPAIPEGCLLLGGAIREFAFAQPIRLPFSAFRSGLAGTSGTGICICRPGPMTLSVRPARSAHLGSTWQGDRQPFGRVPPFLPAGRIRAVT